MLLFWKQTLISMAFFVCNSKARIHAWNQEADVSMSESEKNVIQFAPMADLSFGFTEGSFLLKSGQKDLRSLAKDCILSNNQ